MRGLRQALGIVLLTTLTGCDACAPDRRPSYVDKQGALRMLQGCLFYEDQVRDLLATSVEALAGNESAELDPALAMQRIDRLEEELQAHPAGLRDCVLCQALSGCASALAREDLAHRYQAHHLVQAALALAGYIGDEDLPAALSGQLPPEGGPSLARSLATACLACAAGPQVAQAQELAQIQAACDRLLAARRATLARLERENSGCMDENQPPRVVNGVEVMALPCPAPPEEDLPPLDSCQKFEACGLAFVQARWPKGLSQIAPGSWSLRQLAQSIEEQCPASLEQAAESLKGWYGNRAAPAASQATVRCAPDEPRLGPVLRQACAGPWKEAAHAH